jgi:hypothetical protein
MSVLILYQRRFPKQKSGKNRTSCFRLLIVAGLTFVILVGPGIYAWRSYSAKLTQIDHTVDSFAVNTLPSVVTPDEKGATIKFRWESIYKNPKSGVTLKLPGNWKVLSGRGIQEPDEAHRFCVLGTQTGLSAMFFPRFPDYLPSLNADAVAARDNHLFSRQSFLD